MSEQFQVCNLNGAETFKSPKYFESISNTRENKESELKQFLNANSIVENTSEKHDKFIPNGNSCGKVIPRNGLFGPKKKPSNRLSCSIDYKTTTPEVNLTGSLKRNKVAGSKFSSNSEQKKVEKKCFICEEDGTIQVGSLFRFSGHHYLFPSWT